MVVNGTVYNFHRVEDGITLIDDVHVDGTLSAMFKVRLVLFRPLNRRGNN